MASSGDKVTVENVNHPGKTERVDRAKYEAMRAALLPALPPGNRSGGSTAGWWLKAVHLDLEAKGILARSLKPVRLYRTGGA